MDRRSHVRLAVARSTARSHLLGDRRQRAEPQALRLGGRERSRASLSASSSGNEGGKSRSIISLPFMFA